MKRILTALIIACLSISALAGCQSAPTTVPKAPEVTVDQIVEAFKEKIIEDMMKNDLKEEDVFGPDEDEPGVFFTEDLKKPADQRWMAADIDSADLADGYGIKATFNVQADMILILEAESADKVAGLLEKLNGILDNEKELWSNYLPDQYEHVKNTVLKAEGNMIIYITYANASELEAIFDGLVKG